MNLAWGIALFRPIIELITSVLNIGGSLTKGIVPLLEGLSSMVVWYFTQLYRSLVTVLNNLHVVVLIATLMGASIYSTVHKERAECKAEVQKQREYDKWFYTKGPGAPQKALEPPEIKPESLRRPSSSNRSRQEPRKRFSEERLNAVSRPAVAR